MDYESYFPNRITITLPPLPEGGIVIPATTSTSDQILSLLMNQPYSVMEVNSNHVYEGTPRLLKFVDDMRFRQTQDTRFVAHDFRWQILMQHQQMTLWADETLRSRLRFDIFERGYSQAEIETWAAAHPFMRLNGDGERDWQVYQGKTNPVKSYLLCETMSYLLFWRKEESGLFRKVWEIYGGVQLSGGIVAFGKINANEGFGVGDSTPIIIDAQTGEILVDDPCAHLTQFSYEGGSTWGL